MSEPFQPIPLDQNTRYDLWRFLGDTRPSDMIDAEAKYPRLPPFAIREAHDGHFAELMDTPFTRAFLAWREQLGFVVYASEVPHV